ncbi:MAG: NUDIX domain-containing protein [Spirochaetota bacterium]
MNQPGFFQITLKLFLRDGNRLLILRDKNSGQGDLPGGRLTQEEFFADWLVALQRELYEELGANAKYSINTPHFMLHKHLIDDGEHACLWIGYRGSWQGGEIRLSHEHDFMDWVDVTSYDPTTFFRGTSLEAIQEYLQTI